MKCCTDCKVEKPLSAFGRNKISKDGLYWPCKQCRRRYHQQWRQTAMGKLSTERSKKKRNAYNRKEGKVKTFYLTIKQRYGLSKVDYDILRANHESCAICGCSFSDTKPQIDHDHATGEIRGLLCQLCNMMLGQAKDNPETLRNAINYLEKYAAKAELSCVAADDTNKDSE